MNEFKLFLVPGELYKTKNNVYPDSLGKSFGLVPSGSIVMFVGFEPHSTHKETYYARFLYKKHVVQETISRLDYNSYEDMHNAFRRGLEKIS